jgi:UPF0755 protein
MRKIFILSILVLMVIGFIWQGIYLPKDSAEVVEKLFLVERGENLFQIGENLEREGLIKNKFFFDFYVLMKGRQKNLQAGQYFLSSAIGIPEIAKKIISGDVAKIMVTIPEGWTQKQIEEKLKLKLPGENLEGFLFPDTYQFPLGVSGEEVVRKMKENFEKKLNTKIPELGLTPKEAIIQQGKTIFEIVTMASLIEKEVYNTEECKNCKELVSGILWKRLENNIPLQVDATITYIKKTTNPEGVASRPYGARISKEDTQIDSPYNTYKYLGLPIASICNPGLESILAAIYPKNSDYWYYLSTPEGGTIFSKTLEEHNVAKAKYLK